jgi:hypothetical protein
MTNQILDDRYETGNQSGLNAIDREYLFTAAKWARFLGIVGLVVSGLLAIAAFFITSIMAALNPLMAAQGGRNAFVGGMGTFMTVIYLGIAAIYVFISLYLYNFGTKTKAAVLSNDAELLTEGLKNLKSFFRSIGIMTAVVLGIYAIILVFSLIGFAMVGSKLH